MLQQVFHRHNAIPIVQAIAAKHYYKITTSGGLYLSCPVWVSRPICVIIVE